MVSEYTRNKWIVENLRTILSVLTSMESFWPNSLRCFTAPHNCTVPESQDTYGFKEYLGVTFLFTASREKVLHFPEGDVVKLGRRFKMLFDSVIEIHQPTAFGDTKYLQKHYKKIRNFFTFNLRNTALFGFQPQVPLQVIQDLVKEYEHLTAYRNAHDILRHTPTSPAVYNNKDFNLGDNWGDLAISNWLYENSSAYGYDGFGVNEDYVGYYLKRLESIILTRELDSMRAYERA